LGKVKLAAVMIMMLVAIAVIVTFSYLYICKWSPSTMPERKVGESGIVVGKVESVERGPYRIKVTLRTLSAEIRSPRFQVGDVIEITIAGIGELSSWRAYSLKEGDVIRCQIRWVEDVFWECFDDEWNYA